MAVGPIVWPKTLLFGYIFEISTSNLVCPLLTLWMMGKPILKSIGPYFTIWAHKTSKKPQKWPYLKTLFFPDCTQQKPISSQVFWDIYMLIFASWSQDVRASNYQRLFRNFFHKSRYVSKRGFTDGKCTFWPITGLVKKIQKSLCQLDAPTSCNHDAKIRMYISQKT